MKEPQRIRLNPESPTSKEVVKTPMPSMYKPEWDAMDNQIDDIYSPLDIKKLDINDENNQQNNKTSIQELESDATD